MSTLPKTDPKSPEPEKAEDAAPEAAEKEPEAEKPDPARYGDWTVKGIAVDF